MKNKNLNVTYIRYLLSIVVIKGMVCAWKITVIKTSSQPELSFRLRRSCSTKPLNSSEVCVMGAMKNAHQTMHLLRDGSSIKKNGRLRRFFGEEPCISRVNTLVDGQYAYIYIYINM